MKLQIGMDSMLKLLREFIIQTGFAVYAVQAYRQKNLHSYLIHAFIGFWKLDKDDILDRSRGHRQIRGHLLNTIWTAGHLNTTWTPPGHTWTPPGDVNTTWTLPGHHLDSTWTPEHRLDTTWTPPGHLNAIWTRAGHLNSTWTSPGHHLDTTWTMDIHMTNNFCAAVTEAILFQHLLLLLLVCRHHLYMKTGQTPGYWIATWWHWRVPFWHWISLPIKFSNVALFFIVPKHKIAFPNNAPCTWYKPYHTGLTASIWCWFFPFCYFFSLLFIMLIVFL